MTAAHLSRYDFHPPTRGFAQCTIASNADAGAVAAGVELAG
jgi:hypothetical protein